MSKKLQDTEFAKFRRFMDKADAAVRKNRESLKHTGKKAEDKSEKSKKKAR